MLLYHAMNISVRVVSASFVRRLYTFHHAKYIMYCSYCFSFSFAGRLFVLRCTHKPDIGPAVVFLGRRHACIVCFVTASCCVPRFMRVWLRARAWQICKVDAPPARNLVVCLDHQPCGGRGLPSGECHSTSNQTVLTIRRSHHGYAR